MCPFNTATLCGGRKGSFQSRVGGMGTLLAAPPSEERTQVRFACGQLSVLPWLYSRGSSRVHVGGPASWCLHVLKSRVG